MIDSDSICHFLSHLELMFIKWIRRELFEFLRLLLNCYQPVHQQYFFGVRLDIGQEILKIRKKSCRSLFSRLFVSVPFLGVGSRTAATETSCNQGGFPRFIMYERFFVSIVIACRLVAYVCTGVSL